MKSQPWAKFYFSDWRSDPRLRMCGLAARGLWIEMLALMHEAEPYGHLTVHGRAPTDAQLAVLTGAPLEQIPELLGELESTGVFSRTQKGVIYSRRMTRDAKRSQIARQNGKTGGNPSLSKDTQNTARDNLLDNQTDKGEDNTQKPDAICKNKNNMFENGFDEFWQAWPDRKQSPKKPAQQAFAKALTRAELPEILAGLEKYKVTKPTWKHWSHAATWLNQDRWANEYDDGTSQGSTSLDSSTGLLIAKIASHARTGRWNREDDGPAPGEPGCRVPPSLLQREAA